jgi:hypothetical protein
MAPLTRMRAASSGHAPTDLHAEYYAQRASAGLIIGECTEIGPDAYGWADTPGLWSAEQIRGWRGVTDAVHNKAVLHKLYEFYAHSITIDLLKGQQLVEAAIGYLDAPPSGTANPVVFGSFIEIARAGGGFAFLSGEWEKGSEDDDSSNVRYPDGDSYPEGVAKVSELLAINEETLREDRRIIGSIKLSEVGLAKGGKVINYLHTRGDPDFRPDLPKGRDKTHLKAYFATWGQTKKTITFPMPPDGSAIYLQATLAGKVQSGVNLPDATTLNNWLKGDWGRPLKPQASISDSELLGKQVITGVNYDPSLSFPDQGCALDVGIKLYPLVVEGPAKNEASPRSANYLVAVGRASCMPHERGVFREAGTPSLRSSTTYLSEIYAVQGTRLKFRFEAYYNFQIETSGTDNTPFAIYARGALENAFVKLGPAPANTLPPGIYFDLTRPEDKGFAFDYDGTGRQDHLVLYRPGSGVILISRHVGRNEFRPIGPRSPYGTGIGVFDLKNVNDRIFPFDYAGTGQLDHLVAYRPGGRAIAILKRNGGVFEHVYYEDRGKGIGDFDLSKPEDRALAFDYDDTGKLDHLVFYRPGAGAISILKRDGRNFTPVYSQGPQGKGIGGFDLSKPEDRIFAYDYEGKGRMNHLVLYRPGPGKVSIIKRQGADFVAVYNQDRGGIGGYDLVSPLDRASPMTSKAKR